MASLKTGEEPLINNEKYLGFKLIDFWRWSVSDILSNATRGRLAEFIIATATNIDVTSVRDEWGPYDLITSNNVKLEIKSAAYLQSWEQKMLSKISFSTKLTYGWDDKENRRSLIPQRQADVYVFCLLKHSDKQTINPLDLSQWEFYVLATRQLNDYTRSQHSITLNSLKRLTQAIDYDQIEREIKTKYLLNISQ